MQAGEDDHANDDDVGVGRSVAVGVDGDVGVDAMMAGVVGHGIAIEGVWMNLTDVVRLAIYRFLRKLCYAKRVGLR